jgi:hypothetical protein
MWKLIRKNDRTYEYAPFFALVYRQYALEDKEWPLLTIAIFDELATPFTTTKGFHIAVSYKETEESWFESNYPIPAELLDDIEEMIDEVKVDGQIN